MGLRIPPCLSPLSTPNHVDWTGLEKARFLKNVFRFIGYLGFLGFKFF